MVATKQEVEPRLDAKLTFLTIAAALLYQQYKFVYSLQGTLDYRLA